MTNTLVPSDAIAKLKNDSYLGCANILDKVYDHYPSKDEEFIYLQKPFISIDGEEITAFSINKLMHVRRVLAAWYASIGVTKLDVVTICLSDGIAPYLHYVALTSLGAIPSVINPLMPQDMAKEYIESNSFPLLIVDDVVKKQSIMTGFSAAAGLKIVNVDSHNVNVANDSLPVQWPVVPKDSTVVMISHTSGTTGVSKPVVFEHRQFFMGKRARLRFVRKVVTHTA